MAGAILSKNRIIRALDTSGSNCFANWNFDYAVHQHVSRGLPSLIRHRKTHSDIYFSNRSNCSSDLWSNRRNIMFRNSCNMISSYYFIPFKSFFLSRNYRNKRRIIYVTVCGDKILIKKLICPYKITTRR